MKKIENGTNVIRYNINERYAIRKHKTLNLWWVEDYNFGRDYMPYEPYADSDLKNVVNYLKIIGVSIINK